MHLPCVAKYFQSNAEPRCPHCNDYWPHEIPGVWTLRCSWEGLGQQDAGPGAGEALGDRALKGSRVCGGPH